MPLNAASTITYSTRTRPVRVSAARVNALSISKRLRPDQHPAAVDAIDHHPGEQAYQQYGRNCANETTPSIIEELVSFSTSHACAALCIQVPASEVSWPKK